MARTELRALFCLRREASPGRRSHRHLRMFRRADIGEQAPDVGYLALSSRKRLETNHNLATRESGGHLTGGHSEDCRPSFSTFANRRRTRLGEVAARGLSPPARLTSEHR